MIEEPPMFNTTLKPQGLRSGAGRKQLDQFIPNEYSFEEEIIEKTQCNFSINSS